MSQINQTGRRIIYVMMVVVVLVVICAARRTGWKWSVDHDERATPGS
ncbi:hypothetical protein [Bradyrhizobium elkanii]|nr:hypothetical protein [Bradyrhizobium elkanii]MCS3520641.1 membrane protein YdbS with pleckstrin-like domain [Bradyrhizobium elkanii]MCS4068297.1 membrane protein YdbS with pleckstrin-like domain [Bradyrhizobium elkanii]MCS4083832.1 membrane protein YdbS with pleckstrin-like domain [Bradyrhizobium elkanii]MDH6686538.1 membrane protein YdbS with pleckstrin-like domain [Bradyrhizobium elkanii]